MVGNVGILTSVFDRAWYLKTVSRLRVRTFCGDGMVTSSAQYKTPRNKKLEPRAPLRRGLGLRLEQEGLGDGKGHGGGGCEADDANLTFWVPVLVLGLLRLRQTLRQPMLLLQHVLLLHPHELLLLLLLHQLLLRLHSLLGRDLLRLFRDDRAVNVYCIGQQLRFFSMPE